MAKSYLEGLLGQQERVLLETRQHWFVLFSNIVLEIILTLIVVVGVIALTVMYPIAAIGFVLVLLPLGSMARDILVWYNASLKKPPGSSSASSSTTVPPSTDLNVEVP